MAWAGLGPRTSREPLPAREVERALVAPKGWTALGVGLERANASEGWSADGDPTPLAAPWTRWTVDLTVRHGLAPGWDVFASVPWHRSDAFERQGGVGTARVGTRLSVQRAEAPNRSVAVELAADAPLGASRGAAPSLASGPTAGVLPLTPGTGALRLGLLGRRAVDGLLLDGAVTGVVRPAGRPLWHPGRIDPGDGLEARAAIGLQAGPVLAGPTGELVARGPVRTAPIGGTLVPVPRSAGVEGTLGARVLLQVSRGFELDGCVRRVVLGQDDGFVYAGLQSPRWTQLGVTGRGWF